MSPTPSPANSLQPKPKPKPTTQRRIELDLIRASSIFGVLVIHNLYDWAPPTLAAARMMWSLAGWSVLGFFFLSGCLSRPTRDPEVQLRSGLKRAGELLLVWLIWGGIYLLLGILAQNVGVLSDIPNLFSSSYPFFVFSYQLYFLPVLASLLVLQALTAAGMGALGCSMADMVRFELSIAVLLVVFLSFRMGWPAVPHGSSPSLYIIYALVFLIGVLHARGIGWSLTLSGFTALLALVLQQYGAVSLFVILAPLFPWILRHVMALLHPSLLSLISLISACSGAIYILHHPLLLPCLRRLGRWLQLPDALNYILVLLIGILLPVLLIIQMRPFLGRWPWLARLLLVQTQALHFTK